MPEPNAVLCLIIYFTNVNILLIYFFTDLGGLDQNPVMSDWQKLKKVSMIYNNTNDSPQYQASLRWARRYNDLTLYILDFFIQRHAPFCISWIGRRNVV